MFHVYYAFFPFCQLNLDGYASVMQVQVACNKWPSNFVSKKQSLLTVDKATVIQSGIAYTSVQTLSIVNKCVSTEDIRSQRNLYSGSFVSNT